MAIVLMADDKSRKMMQRLRSLQWRRAHKFWKNHHAKCKTSPTEKASLDGDVVAVAAENNAAKNKHINLSHADHQHQLACNIIHPF
jgi:hypothetical protein